MKNCRFDLRSTSVRHRWLIVLLGVSLAVYFLLLIPGLVDPLRVFVTPDAMRYELLAKNLLSGNGYSLATAPPYTVDSAFVPIYPLLLAGIYAICGRVFYVMVVIQILLVLALVALMIRWGSERFSIKIGIITGIFLLFDMGLAFSSVQLMPDVLFLAFLIPSLWFVLRLFEEKASIRSGLGAGVLLGIATLIRPIGLYFPLLVPFLFLTKKPTRARLMGYGVLLLSYILIVSPWFVRNRLVFGRFFLSSVQWVNLVERHAAPVKAAIEEKTPLEAEFDIKERAFERHGRPIGHADSFFIASREAIRYVIKHPVRYAGIYFAGILKTFLPLGLIEFPRFYTNPQLEFRSIGALIHTEILLLRFGEALRLIWEERVVSTGGIFFLYVAAFLFKLFIIGLALRGFLIKGFRSPFNLLAFMVAIYFIGVTGPAGQPRHFLPLLPLAALLAAHGLASGNLKKTNTLRRL